jgi:phage terminase large subunit-like protein
LPEALPRLVPGNLATQALVRLLVANNPTSNARWSPQEHQKPPPKPWRWWFLLAGRSSGKTDAGADYVDKWARGHPRGRIMIVAPTLTDARETCVRGPSGLLAHNPQIVFVASPSGLCRWPNGAEARIFGAYTPEDVERMRGPQCHLLWGDELAAWRYLAQMWEQLEMVVRLGTDPHGVFTSTPKPRPTLRALLADPECVTTRASIESNAYNDPATVERLRRIYAGTRTERQELEGQLLEDIPGALWQAEWIESARVTRAPDDLVRAVVAIDPSATAGEEASETGIVVVALSRQREAYVLADLSGHMSPDEWGRAAVAAYDRWHADRIVGEVNHGGDMIEAVVRSAGAHVAYRAVRASRGKAIRAEPVSALTQQGRVHMVGEHRQLEDQLVTWTPESTDVASDRLDALVWGVTELGLVEPTSFRLLAGHLE